MQADVDYILTQAAAVPAITKASARALRETDDYPFLYVGGRSVPRGGNTSQTTTKKRYTQAWEYTCQLYLRANTDTSPDTTYSDYEQAETIVSSLLTQILENGAGEWELLELNYYPANLGGHDIIVAEITLQKINTADFSS